MTEIADDQLNVMLKDGWVIAGYAVCMLAGGVLAHSMLLQKEDALQSMTIVSAKDKEMGRTLCVLSPKPVELKKKGLFAKPAN